MEGEVEEGLSNSKHLYLLYDRVESCDPVLQSLKSLKGKNQITKKPQTEPITFLNNSYFVFVFTAQDYSSDLFFLEKDYNLPLSQIQLQNEENVLVVVHPFGKKAEKRWKNTKDCVKMLQHNQPLIEDIYTSERLFCTLDADFSLKLRRRLDLEIKRENTGGSSGCCSSFCQTNREGCNALCSLFILVQCFLIVFLCFLATRNEQNVNRLLLQNEQILAALHQMKEIIQGPDNASDISVLEILKLLHKRL